MKDIAKSWAEYYASFKLLLTKKQAPTMPRFVEVGKAIVSITTIDNTEYKIEFVGNWGYDRMVYAFDKKFVDEITTADDKVNAWRKQGGQQGTLWVGNAHYKPLQQIKDISSNLSALNSESA